MSQSRLIPLTYYDPGKEVRLTVYADTIILDRSGEGSVISAVRFGGYPEMVKAMSDAIYGGATIEMPFNGETRQLKAIPKQYRRQMSHDGQYAVGTLMVNDDPRPLIPRTMKMNQTRPANSRPSSPGSATSSSPPGTGTGSLRSWTARPQHPSSRSSGTLFWTPSSTGASCGRWRSSP